MFGTQERSVSAKYALRLAVPGLEGEIQKQISQKRKKIVLSL